MSTGGEGNILQMNLGLYFYPNVKAANRICEYKSKTKPDSVEALQAPTAAASNAVLRTVMSFTASTDFTV